MPIEDIPARPLIVFSFDALATAALGCYGSSWNRTPAIDTVASGGCVWDRLVSADERQAGWLNALFDQNLDAIDWADSFRDRGSIELITDDPLIGQTGECFDIVTTVDAEDPQAGVGDDLPATDLESTCLASLVAAAIERDASDPPWSLLWLHSNFLTRCWDAPRDLFPVDEIESMVMDDEADVEPDRSQPLIYPNTSVPNIELPSDRHPDHVNAWMRTYGCQVRLIDVMLEVLLQSIRVDDPMVMILGTRGFSLGQNGWIGHRAGPLRSPELRLPMIISDIGPVRIGSLTSSNQIGSMLADLGRSQTPWLSPENWAADDIDDLVAETRTDRAQACATTPGWFYVRDPDASEHLFLKPDDVEDFNDIARLRPDVRDRLSGLES